MTLDPGMIITIERTLLVGGWLVFGGIFVLRKRRPQAPTRTRDRRSWIGMLLQGAAYAFLWSFRRSAPAAGSGLLEVVRGVGAVALMGVSIGLASAAIRTLGKEWSLTARVAESHELVTRGPYAWVRHPIYSGMLGMLLATGIGVSTLPALAVALAVALTGVMIRVRLEEDLLRRSFGEAYDAYARRVPALIPRPPRA